MNQCSDLCKSILRFQRNDTLSGVMAAPRGEKRRIAWSEWLDSFYLSDLSKQKVMLAECPPKDGSVWDALLAGAVLWLAHMLEITPPKWIKDESRVLPKPFFMSNGKTSRQVLFWTAFPEFLRYNVLGDIDFFDRPRMPLSWRPAPEKWEQEWAIDLATKFNDRRQKRIQNGDQQRLV